MKAHLLLPLSACLLLACGEEKDDTAETGETVSESLCPDLEQLPCEDDIVADLLTESDEISDGQVTTTTDGDDLVTIVDATAGGMNQAASNPWVYVRFDAEGASRVDIGDEDALESADWHVALRRYHIRLNGGDGGPSCVGSAKMAAYDYADLTEEPSGVDYQLEDFYDDAWHRVLLTVDEGENEATVWVDDVLRTTAARGSGGTFQAGMVSLVGGRHDLHPDTHFLGELDRVCMWSRVVTVSEADGC